MLHGLALDPVRSGVMVAWATFGDTPLNMLLLRAIGSVSLANTLAGSAVKAVMFFVPGACLRNPLFLAVATAMEDMVNGALGRQALPFDSAVCAEKVRRKLEDDLVPLLQTSAVVWLPVNTAAFYVVPARLRPVFLSTVAVLWGTYLSLVQHRGVGHDKEPE